MQPIKNKLQMLPAWPDPWERDHGFFFLSVFFTRSLNICSAECSERTAASATVRLSVTGSPPTHSKPPITMYSAAKVSP